MLAYDSKVQHFRGLPTEVTGDPESARLMPVAKFILFLENERGFYLLRYDQEGNDVGETSHGTIPSAKNEAKYEFNIKAESQWTDILKMCKKMKN